MEDNSYDHLIQALIEGNPEKLKAITTNNNFDPNFHIKTSCGCLDSFTYLLMQTFPDDSKTCALANILHNANIRITLPSETKYFTVFHFVKSKIILDYFINKANIKNPKALLDTYYKDDKETLFLKLSIELVPFEEIKKIYESYKPDLHFKTTADGTILHHLLAFYLFHNLNAQHYYSKPTQRIADIVSEDLFRFAITYQYMKETYNKFKFFVNDGTIDPLAKNKYGQTPYQFYTLLLNGLEMNTLNLFIPQYPEYEDLMKILFSRKIGFGKVKIPLTRFFKESFNLAQLIEDFTIRIVETKKSTR
jgi:hypothetical protein